MCVGFRGKGLGFKVCVGCGVWELHRGSLGLYTDIWPLFPRTPRNIRKHCKMPLRFQVLDFGYLAWEGLGLTKKKLNSTTTWGRRQKFTGKNRFFSLRA